MRSTHPSRGRGALPTVGAASGPALPCESESGSPAACYSTSTGCYGSRSPWGAETWEPLRTTVVAVSLPLSLFFLSLPVLCLSLVFSLPLPLSLRLLRTATHYRRRRSSVALPSLFFLLPSCVLSFVWCVSLPLRPTPSYGSDATTERGIATTESSFVPHRLH